MEHNGVFALLLLTVWWSHSPFLLYLGRCCITWLHNSCCAGFLTFIVLSVPVCSLFLPFFKIHWHTSYRIREYVCRIALLNHEQVWVLGVCSTKITHISNPAFSAELILFHINSHLHFAIKFFFFFFLLGFLRGYNSNYSWLKSSAGAFLNFLAAVFGKLCETFHSNMQRLPLWHALLKREPYTPQVQAQFERQQ